MVYQAQVHITDLSGVSDCVLYNQELLRNIAGHHVLHDALKQLVSVVSIFNLLSTKAFIPAVCAICVDKHL